MRYLAAAGAVPTRYLVGLPWRHSQRTSPHATAGIQQALRVGSKEAPRARSADL